MRSIKRGCPGVRCDLPGLRWRGQGVPALKIPGVHGTQNVLNGVSMAVRVMEKALYSSYTQEAGDK